MFVGRFVPSKCGGRKCDRAAYGNNSPPPTFQVLHAGAASAAVTRAVNPGCEGGRFESAGRGIGSIYQQAQQRL